MFAREIDQVHFDFRISEEHKEYPMASGGGKLYLTEDGLLLSDEKSWYQIPLEKIRNIQKIDHDEAVLKFDLPGINVLIVGGENGPLLPALRHYLLPYL